MILPRVRRLFAYLSKRHPNTIMWFITVLWITFVVAVAVGRH